MSRLDDAEEQGFDPITSPRYTSRYSASFTRELERESVETFLRYAQPDVNSSRSSAYFTDSDSQSHGT